MFIGLFFKMSKVMKSILNKKKIIFGFENLSLDMIMYRIMQTKNVHPMLKKATEQAIKSGREMEFIQILKTKNKQHRYFDNIEEVIITSILNFED